jgi:alcohol dehydrogenase class IV
MHTLIDVPPKFNYLSYAQEIIFASGSLARLGEAVERFGRQRLMLCTNRSMRAGGHAASVEALLGGRLVAAFDQVQPHVHGVQVDEALALAVAREVDAIIGLGGGSSIGMAKAVASRLEEISSSHPGRAAASTAQPLVPVIAIPTTYAGSEMTAVYGITHTQEAPPRKVTFSDPKIAPRLVIYDPELTLDLPPEMTASTGINALAHCIEALYSVRRHPLSTAAAINGVRHINNALLCCYTNGDDLEARTEMLLGAHLAGLSLASVTMGLHHGLCHVLGGTANIPHGIANSIILPHAMRFNADATTPQLLPAAEALGIKVNGLSPAGVIEAAVNRIFVLVGQMNLPQRLRDAGVKESDLPHLARLGFQNRTVNNNPKPITDAAQLERLLRDAW